MTTRFDDISASLFIHQCLTTPIDHDEHASEIANACELRTKVNPNAGLCAAMNSLQLLLDVTIKG